MKPPQELTPEQLASRLKWASHRHVGAMLFGGTSRAAVIERIEGIAPGFSVAEYSAALDNVAPSIVAGRANALRRREQLVEKALEQNLLNAIYCLRFFNYRHWLEDEHLGLYGIDIYASLIPQYTQRKIDRALPYVDAAINAGRTSHPNDLRGLRAAYPKITDENHNQALWWSAFINR